MNQKHIAINCNKEAGLRIWLEIMQGEHNVIKPDDTVWWFQTQVRSVCKNESGMWIEYGEPWTKHMITNCLQWFTSLTRDKKYELKYTHKGANNA
jgi:hypothetical protein